MQTLVLIRHALAEDRQTWRGADDLQRPLTPSGRRQAQDIAGVVLKSIQGMGREAAIVSLRSSPALRCLDTVRPLAKKAGISIDVDKSLLEGSEIKPPPPREEGVHIFSAHGDNIPWLLESLKITWDGQCKKGSIWTIQRDGRGRVRCAQYRAISKR